MWKTVQREGVQPLSCSWSTPGPHAQFAKEQPFRLARVNRAFQNVQQLDSAAQFSLAFNRSLFSAMNVLISSAMSSNFFHCSWYSVTGNRPSP